MFRQYLHRSVNLFNIKYWRLKRNLTRAQLALTLGTTHGYIYEIETEKKSPSLKMFYRIAEALEIEIYIKDLHESEYEK